MVPFDSLSLSPVALTVDPVNGKGMGGGMEPSRGGRDRRAPRFTRDDSPICERAAATAPPDCKPDVKSIALAMLKTN